MQTFSGQPSIENGHKPEENQVSSTSSSCWREKGFPPASFSARWVASSSVRPTTQFLPSAGCSKLKSAAGHRRRSENTHIRSLSFNHDEVSGASVTPPQLPGDAPVLNAAQPRIPFGFGRLGVDFEFAFSCSLGSVTQASK